MRRLRAGAVAEALRPSATVNSVIETALAQLPAEARKEVEQGLDWARRARDWKELRPLYEKKYEGKPISNAVEVLSGGLACFYASQGRPREAILYAVNLGRDTDCKAYVAGGLAGAMRGVEALPKEWVELIEKQALTDPYTAAQGLHAACLNELRNMKRAAAEMEAMK